MNQKLFDLKTRRQWLSTAAALGVAPWLLSAAAAPTGAPRTAADGPTADARPASRRRLGALEVFPIGLGCQWQPGRQPQAVNDL